MGFFSLLFFLVLVFFLVLFIADGVKNAKITIFPVILRGIQQKSRPNERDFFISKTLLDYSIVQVEPLLSRSSMFLIFELAFSFSMTSKRLSLKVGAFTSRMTPMATGK